MLFRSIKPFKVHRAPFLRDVGFFTAAVMLLLVILWDGIMQPWEAGIMIALYLFYVAIVVFGSWWDRRQEVKRHSEAMERAQYDQTPLAFQEPYRDNREQHNAYSDAGLISIQLAHRHLVK